MTAKQVQIHSGGVLIPLRKRKKTPPDPRESAFKKEFGARLKLARGSRLTQEQVATALGIGVHQYRKHELGQRSFPTYLLVSVSVLLDKSVSWMLTGRG